MGDHLGSWPPQLLLLVSTSGTNKIYTIFEMIWQHIDHILFNSELAPRLEILKICHFKYPKHVLLIIGLVKYTLIHCAYILLV